MVLGHVFWRLGVLDEKVSVTWQAFIIQWIRNRGAFLGLDRLMNQTNKLTNKLTNKAHSNLRTDAFPSIIVSFQKNVQQDLS